MQHANRSATFDNNDNNNNNQSHSHSHSIIGAIGASTSGAMAQFAQNNLILMAFTSMHFILWQLFKLLTMSSGQQKLKQHRNIETNKQQCGMKAVDRRKTSSSISSLVTAPIFSILCCCCSCYKNYFHSSNHATSSLSLMQFFQQQPPLKIEKQQQQEQEVVHQLQVQLIEHEQNAAMALMYFYHNIQR